MPRRDGIGIRYCYSWGKSYRIITNLLERKGLLSDRPRLLLNFGSDFDSDEMTVLNKKISPMKDKIIMNKIFDEHNITHPKSFYYPFRHLPNDHIKCVVKTRFGGRGRGILFTYFDQININSLDRDHYIQCYIPIDKEFRVVNFIHNYRCREKIGSTRIKNSKSCRFKNFRNPRLEAFGKRICDVFEADYAGIDIGMYDNGLFAIEINSAAGINENSASTLLYFLTNYYYALLR